METFHKALLKKWLLFLTARLIICWKLKLAKIRSPQNPHAPARLHHMFGKIRELRPAAGLPRWPLTRAVGEKEVNIDAKHQKAPPGGAQRM